MKIPSWLGKIAGYAPDIALAIATGGTSAIATTALRIAAKELTGDENSPISAVKQAVENATPDQLLNLERENNSFKVKMRTIELEEKKIDTQDVQSEHQTTQETIKNGDNSSSKLVRYTRPLQSWISLAAAIYYALNNPTPDTYILGALLTLPFTYAGLRQLGKWKTTDALTKLK